MVIDKEYLEGHMNVNLIRHGIFVEKIEIERLCVVNVSITHLQPPFRRCSG